MVCGALIQMPRLYECMLLLYLVHSYVFTSLRLLLHYCCVCILKSLDVIYVILNSIWLQPIVSLLTESSKKIGGTLQDLSFGLLEQHHYIPKPSLINFGLNYAYHHLTGLLPQTLRAIKSFWAKFFWSMVTNLQSDGEKFGANSLVHLKTTEDEWRRSTNIKVMHLCKLRENIIVFTVWAKTRRWLDHTLTMAEQKFVKIVKYGV